MEVEQARLNTLNSLIKALEGNQNELQTAFDEMTEAEARQNLIETARERDLVALEAKRREKEELLSHALEATRQRIIRYRIDHELPPLSPQKLAVMAAETHHRSARA